MANLWERFDGIAKPEEVQEAKSQFSPLEPGNYEVMLEELVPGESQAGLPMIKGKFRCLQGGRIIFYNQLLQNVNNPNMTAINIAEALKFVSAIARDEVEFVSLSQFADDIIGIGNGNKGEQYTLKVSYGAKDLEMKYPKLKVVETTYADFAETTPADGEEIPF